MRSTIAYDISVRRLKQFY